MWATIVSLLAHLLFWLGLILALVIIPFGLPGTFAIATLALVYGLFTHFVRIPLYDVFILYGLAVVAELIDYFLGAFTVKRFGGSNLAMLGAIVGGFLGAVWATPVFPVIGTLLGAFAGAFMGAFGVEFLLLKGFDRAIRAGWGAFLGALGGKITKITIGIAMVVIIVFRFI